MAQPNSGFCQGKDMAEIRRERRTEITEGDAAGDPEIGEYKRQEEVDNRAARIDPTPREGAVAYESRSDVVDPYASRRQRAYKLQQAIYLIFGLIEALIAIRFVLMVLAANPNAGFAQFIYGITAPFMAPFVGLFGEPRLGGSVFEWTALVAIVVYMLLAWALVKIVWLVVGDTRRGVASSHVDTRIDR
jgi:hypothetical protein